MASGAVHTQANVCLAVASGIAAIATGNVELGLGLATGCLVEVFMGSDLDQEGIGAGEWKIIRATFGLGFLWTMFWYPYARLIPHRSPWSHWPGLGTAIRLLYLLAIPVGLAWWYRLDLSWVPLTFCKGIVAGLFIGDFGHWVLDGFPGLSVHRKRVWR